MILMGALDNLKLDLDEWPLAVWIDGLQVPVPWHQQVSDILLLQRRLWAINVCNVCVVCIDLEVQWRAVYTTAVNDIDVDSTRSSNLFNALLHPSCTGIVYRRVFG